MLNAVVDSKVLQGGSTALGNNFNIYQDVKKKAFEDLSDTDKACWEALAKEHNEKIKAQLGNFGGFDFRKFPCKI